MVRSLGRHCHELYPAIAMPSGSVFLLEAAMPDWRLTQRRAQKLCSHISACPLHLYTAERQRQQATKSAPATRLYCLLGVPRNYVSGWPFRFESVA